MDPVTWFDLQIWLCTHPNDCIMEVNIGMLLAKQHKLHGFALLVVFGEEDVCPGEDTPHPEQKGESREGNEAAVGATAMGDGRGFE